MTRDDRLTFYAQFPVSVLPQIGGFRFARSQLRSGSVFGFRFALSCHLCSELFPCLFASLPSLSEVGILKNLVSGFLPNSDFHEFPHKTLDFPQLPRIPLLFPS